MRLLPVAGQNFVLSLFDRLWHKDLTEEEAVKLMELGIEEVQILGICLCSDLQLSKNCFAVPQ